MNSEEISGALPCGPGCQPSASAASADATASSQSGIPNAWPPTLELPSAGTHGSGSGSDIRYQVEARTTYSSPTQVGAMLVDNVWRTVPMAFAPDGVGVPSRRSWDGSDGHGTYNYEAAEALRWWFLALAAAEPLGSLCLETRLVAIRYHYTYRLEELGVCKEVVGDARRRPFDPARPRRAASGIEGEAGDPQGLHPKGETPVGAAETPKPPSE